MHPEASRILTTLNSWVNTNEVLTLLVVATISGLAGWLFRVTRRGRRFGWSVLYDEPINQGDPSAKPSVDLLTYVDQTPGAIGYAEADALPFFPDVGAIATPGPGWCGSPSAAWPPSRSPGRPRPRSRPSGPGTWAGPAPPSSAAR